MSYGEPISAPTSSREELLEALRRNDLPDIANILLLGMPADEAVSLASLRVKDSIGLRMPGIADLGSFTNAAEMAAAQYALEQKIVNQITRQQLAKSRAMSRAEERISQRIAERR